MLPEIASVKICVNGAIPLDGMATTFRSLVLSVALLGCWALRPRSGLYAMNLKLFHALLMRLWFDAHPYDDLCRRRSAKEPHKGATLL